MKIILLPGHARSNKDWLHSLAFSLRELNVPVQLFHYDHWHDSGKEADIDHEYQTLVHQLKNEKDYILIGKSMGAELALRGITQKKIGPSGAILIDVPGETKSSRGLKASLDLLHVPSVFPQHDFDSEEAVPAVKALLSKASR